MRVGFEVHEIKGIFLHKNELVTFLAHLIMVYKQNPANQNNSWLWLIWLMSLLLKYEIFALLYRTDKVYMYL